MMSDMSKLSEIVDLGDLLGVMGPIMTKKLEIEL